MGFKGFKGLDIANSLTNGLVSISYSNLFTEVLTKSKRRINFVQLKDNQIYDDYNINYIYKNKEYLEDNQYFEKIIFQHQDFHLDIKKEFINNFTYMNDFFNMKVLKL